MSIYHHYSKQIHFSSSAERDSVNSLFCPHLLLSSILNGTCGLGAHITIPAPCWLAVVPSGHLLASNVLVCQHQVGFGDVLVVLQLC